MRTVSESSEGADVPPMSDVAELGDRLCAQMARVLSSPPGDLIEPVSEGADADVIGWLADLATEAAARPARVVTPRRLREWVNAVVHEAYALGCTRVLDGDRSGDALERALAVAPVGDQLRHLLATDVPRDFVTAEGVAAVAPAVRRLLQARTQFHIAQKAYPRDRVRDSVSTLDLGKEIAALRTGPGWLFWDYSTSDAARNRVREHFAAGHGKRDRHQLAADLELVRALVQAEQALTQAERTHRAVLGPLFPAHREGGWNGPGVLKRIRSVQRAQEQGQFGPADLDAVWSMPGSLTHDRSWWKSLEALREARTRRAACVLERHAPALSRVSAASLQRLRADDVAALRARVLRHARVFDLLLSDPRARVATPGRGSPGGARLHEVFEEARRQLAAEPDLSGQLTAAVTASRRAFKVLEHEVDQVLDAALPDDGGSEAAWSEQAQELRAALRRRGAAMDSFRIVLFGRTGAGKSSFVEALSRGDGTSISTGESDYTTESANVRWGACTLVDTPGIQGWGRKAKTEHLEREARQALDTADLVVLAFDTQNQKEGEFRKVAQWVLDYDKPVLSVLNVRNPQWRRPDKEPDPGVRRGHSLSVAEHAQHTHDALASYGLPDALPIAINGLNAVAGRCPDYTGPYAEGVRALRQRLGAERLEEFSNFAVIESLLSELLGQSALDLRLQSLANDIRHRLRGLADGLDAEAAGALDAAVSAEARVDRVLTLIGAGAGPEQALLDRNWRRGSIFGTAAGTDLLTDLEQQRQAPFAASALYGTVWDSWEDHCAVRLDAAHRRTMRTVEDELRDAFQQGRQLTASDIDALYRAAAEQLAQAAEAATRAVLVDLTRDIAAAAERLAAQAAHAQATSDRGLNGGAGTTGRNVARALNVAAGVLVFVPLPGVNLLAAAGVRIVGQLLLSIFSARTRRAAEETRAAEFRYALTSARNAITEMRVDLEQACVRTVRDWTGTLAGALRPELEGAIAARGRSAQYTASADALRALLQTLPEEGAGSAALVRAKDALALDGQGDALGWRALALGEDWLGAEPGAARSAPSAPAAVPPALAEPFAGLLPALTKCPDPSAPATREWLQRLADSAEDEVVAIAAAALAKRTGGPALALTGPPRVGVTSLHASLAAQRSDGLENLRDASAHSDHQQVLAAADLVGLLMPPSLFGAGEDPLEHLGPPCLLEDTKRRLVLLLTRIDELAIDPDEMPEQLAAAVQRKVAEVRRYAARIGLPKGLPVLPVSGSPYGQPVGEFLPWWSGIDRLAVALEGGLPVMSGNAAVVRRVVAELDALCASTEADVQEALRPAVEAVAARLGAVGAARRRGEQLQVALGDQLTTALEGIAIPLAYELSGASNGQSLREAQDALNGWRQRPEVDAAFDRFEQSAIPRVQEWLAGTGRTIEATAHRPSPQAATPRKGPDNDPASAVRTVRTATSQVGKLGATLGKHSEYYRLGKELGVKFKPWQAVKGAQRVAKVTKGLGVLSVALLGYEMWKTERAEKARNEMRAQAPDVVRREVADLVDTYLRGTATAPGLGGQVQRALRALQADADAAERDHAAASARCDRFQSLLDAAGAARADGLRLLNESAGKRS